MTPQDAERMVRQRVGRRLYEHCRGVAATCAELAGLWGAPVVEAEVAGWLHDYCKEWTAEELLSRAEELGLSVDPVERLRPVQLLHAGVAAAELAALGVPASVCAAIRRHTVGGSGMSVLERCLYVADAVEPGRRYDGVEEARQLSRRSLDDAVAWCARRTLMRLVERGRPIHPATVALYNEACVARGG
jgi:predicted HD superfamily hydrolase involved in NAD metabolism